MLRNIAVVTAFIACAAGAGSVSAQSAAPAKPVSHAQKSPTTTSAHTDTTKTSAMRHAPWTKEQIEQAQTGLAKAGYYKGKPTGEMNSDTRKALKAFEKANNLPANGRLSDSVLVKLKSA